MGRRHPFRVAQTSLYASPLAVHWLLVVIIDGCADHGPVLKPLKTLPARMRWPDSANAA